MVKNNKAIYRYKKRSISASLMVPRLGIEPRTQGFSVPCSTN